MHTEEEIRRRVKKLQQFYMNLLVFVGVNVLFSLVWLTSHRGTPFWPKYIIIIWGMFLIIKAYRMKIFSQYIPFLTPEWEKQKVQELMSKEADKPAAPKKVAVPSQKAPQKKAAQPKKASAPKKVSEAKAKKPSAPAKTKKS